MAAALGQLPGRTLLDVTDLYRDIHTSWKLVEDRIEDQDEEEHEDEDDRNETRVRGEVLDNDDLLHSIFKYCPRKDIQSLRLASRTFEAAASPFLFETLKVGRRKRFIRRLNRVAAIEKFSKGVREVVCEDVRYLALCPWTESDVKGFLEIYGLDVTAIPKAKLKRLRAKLDRFAADDTDCQEDFYRAIITAAPSLTGVQRVTLTRWAQPEDSSLAMPAFLEHDGHAPPPLALFMEDSDAANARTMSSFIMLVAMPEQLGIRIKELVVRPTNQSKLDNNTSRFATEYLPGLMLDALDLPADLLPSLGSATQHLRKLHLDLAIKDLRSTNIKLMRKLIAEEAVWEIFHDLPCLEDLFVSIASVRTMEGPVVLTCIVPLSKIFNLQKPYPALRKLHLGSFWLEPAELCQMIEAHSSTLQHLTLTDINLGGTNDAMTLEPGLAVLQMPRRRVHPAAQQATHLEWLAIAETCQKMPRLSGLLFQSPSVTQDWTYLPEFETEDLMEVGMGGRANELYLNRHWSSDLGW